MLSGLQVTRLWPYGGPGFNYGSFAGKTAAPIVARSTGAGRAKRKRRYQVEIDGEVFDAESVDDALEILAKAKDQAQAIADDAVAKAVKAKRRQPRKVAADATRALQLPTIEAPGIQEAVASVLADIRAIYERAAKTIDIELAMRRRDAAIDEDDEEILLLL